MRYHLAQANLAVLRAKPGEPQMAGLVAQINDMNMLAERSPGFVWRMLSSEGTPEALRVLDGYFPTFALDRIFYNMSVWESVAHLRQYVFQSEHARMLRQKEQWMDHFERPHLALWWLPAGQRPTILDSAKR